MATKKKSLLAAAGNAGEALAIEDVFSTYLYTGNGSTQTITNGIDLAGEGGLVWIKAREPITNSGSNGFHVLYDTDRGATKALYSNTTDAEVTRSGGLTSFNSDGFTVGNFGYEVGASDKTTAIASWTFRKAPRFFDIVDNIIMPASAAVTVNHNLEIEPGVIILKEKDGGNNWFVYHRSTGEGKYLWLDSTAPVQTYSPIFTSVSSTSFSTRTNTPGTYIAYLFAHDPLGPSGDGSDGLIACGSMSSGSVGNNTTVDLGWEPQWILFKNATGTGSPDWWIYDTMRGWTGSLGDPNNAYLFANTSGAEGSITNYINITPTGFVMEGGAFDSNATFIYIAIRRGPMRQPESGAEVFRPAARAEAESITYDVQLYSGWPVDLALERNIASGTDGVAWWDRLRAAPGTAYYLKSSDTNAEASSALSRPFDTMHGFRAGDSSTTYNNLNGWLFRRAPGFFDVVAYTGDGVAGRTVSHNLGVAPELMIGKRRDSTGGWYVYSSSLTSSDFLRLDSSGAAQLNQALGIWYNTDPTSTNFTLGNNQNVNASGGTYIVYLFATLPGVSKVGSYTGNGTSQTINCGFTSGARFILIKRTDSTGDWYVWDTERGIVAANDPHLSLNTTAAEVTTDDSVDPDSSGFIVNQVAATNINVSSASYIFYAVA